MSVCSGVYVFAKGCMFCCPQVLQSIKVNIDGLSRSEEGLEVRLCRARKTMVYWAKVRNDQVEESIGAQIVAEARQLQKQASLATDIGNTAVEVGQKEGQKIKTAAATSGDEKGTDIISSAVSPKRHKAGKKRKAPTNSLFAMVIFQEFLRELATISQLHASLYPCLHVFRSEQFDV